MWYSVWKHACCIVATYWSSKAVSQFLAVQNRDPKKWHSWVLMSFSACWSSEEFFWRCSAGVYCNDNNQIKFVPPELNILSFRALKKDLSWSIHEHYDCSWKLIVSGGTNSWSNGWLERLSCRMIFHQMVEGATLPLQLQEISWQQKFKDADYQWWPSIDL